MSRPDYIKCVLLGTKDEPTTTWCSRKTDAFEWAFLDATHAALTGRNGGRQVPCEKCAAAIVKALCGGDGGKERKG